MSALPTNYVDAVLDATANTRRKYNLIENGDGTVSLEDVTVYATEGSEFGAGNINESNAAINNKVTVNNVASKKIDVTMTNGNLYITTSDQ